MRDGKELKPCLSGRGVTKVFGFGDAKTVAVDHVDFDFHEGEFVSIVGESGSGKTTLSKMLLGLISVTEGEIDFQGKPRDISNGKKKKEYWKGIQAIFQDPFASYNMDLVQIWHCLLHFIDYADAVVSKLLIIALRDLLSPPEMKKIFFQRFILLQRIYNH